MKGAGQHGFTKRSSRLTDLVVFCEAVSNCVDEGNAVDVVDLNFQKEF